MLLLAIFSSLAYKGQANSNTSEACAGVLFVYFDWSKSKGSQFFALSRDGFKFDELNGGRPIPPLSAQNASVRDPFLRQSPRDGRYHLVATNGAGFGGRDNILHWSSADLVSWSPMNSLEVMKAHKDEIANTWAPEWAWDAEQQEHLIFWAVAWKNRTGPVWSPACNYSSAGHPFFTFWAVRTKDFATISQPFRFFNPGCLTSQLDPYVYSEGGIDGNLWVDNANEDGRTSFHFFYKDTSAPKSSSDTQAWSGTRTVSSATLAGFYGDEPKPYASPTDPRRGLLGDNDNEGPEMLVVNGTMHLYYDCSFHETPPGWPRPPYGLATAPAPRGLTDPGAWTPAPGSCGVGFNGSSPPAGGVAFPKGATHGSFICVTEETYQHLLKAFPI